MYIFRTQLLVFLDPQRIQAAKLQLLRRRSSLISWGRVGHQLEWSTNHQSSIRNSFAMSYLKTNNKKMNRKKLLHFEWSPPWHHIDTYLSQILTFFVLKSGEDEKERIILMKSRGLRPLDFIRIILSSSSLLLVRDPAVTTVIYLIQTDSRYAWFQRISDARASPVA